MHDETVEKVVYHILYKIRRWIILYFNKYNIKFSIDSLTVEYLNYGKLDHGRAIMCVGKRNDRIYILNMSDINECKWVIFDICDKDFYKQIIKHIEKDINMIYDIKPNRSTNEY